MKRFLLPEQGACYKANLHCHSTLSDGEQTPEEIKRDYKAYGYSVVAYTDHDIMIPHHDLTDEDFLALTGYEMEVGAVDGPVKGKKFCHMCLIALDPDKREQVCYHRTRYLYHNAVNYRDQLCFDHSLPDYVRQYSHEGISDVMRTGRENGFFVTYNHPNLSLETGADFMGYEHMHAMEMGNTNSVLEGFPDDYNGKEYDQMLRGGKRIFCIATDDNHTRADRYGAFTVIKAEKLDYKTITDALLAGHFYASRGPEIHELWVEDGKIHIACSDAARIVMNTGIRKAEIVCAPEGGVLNAADFRIDPDCIYVRLTVYDREGMYAATNAYFAEELFG